MRNHNFKTKKAIKVINADKKPGNLATDLTVQIFEDLDSKEFVRTLIFALRSETIILYYYFHQVLNKNPKYRINPIFPLDSTINQLICHQTPKYINNQKWHVWQSKRKIERNYNKVNDLRLVESKPETEEKSSLRNLKETQKKWRHWLKKLTVFVSCLHDCAFQRSRLASVVLFSSQYHGITAQ